MENQHPFYANGLSFIHNGDISDANGRNIVTNRSYPVNHSVFLSTGGRSDSAIFFAVILEYIGFGFSLDEAVAQAARELRQAYPKSSYNCMIQSEDQLIALCAAGREKTSPRIVEIYDEYGRGEQAADYRVMRYRELRDDNGDSAGVVVSSSGYKQEGWNVLENDQMIIVSNRNGTFHLKYLHKPPLTRGLSADRLTWGETPRASNHPHPILLRQRRNIRHAILGYQIQPSLFVLSAKSLGSGRIRLDLQELRRH